MAYKYKVVEGEGMEAVIEKSGLKHTFSLKDIKLDLEKIEKFRKEKSAQIDVETAKIKNVLEHHPKLGDLSDVEIGGSFILFEAKKMIEAIQNKFKELDELETEYKKDIELIESQVGIKYE